MVILLIDTLQVGGRDPGVMMHAARRRGLTEIMQGSNRCSMEGMRAQGFGRPRAAFDASQTPPRGRLLASILLLRQARSDPRPDMSFMVYIDEYAAWSAASLQGALDLAQGYIESGRPLKIVDYQRSGIGRTWVYDYEKSAWREPGAGEEG